MVSFTNDSGGLVTLLTKVVVWCSRYKLLLDDVGILTSCCSVTLTTKELNFTVLGMLVKDTSCKSEHYTACQNRAHFDDWYIMSLHL